MASNQELKSLWLGPSGTLGAAGESELFYPGELGKTQWHKDPNDSDEPIQIQKVLRYASDGATAAAGKVCYWQDRDNYVVSGDVGDAVGGSTNPFVAGVWLGTGPSVGYYGCIQVGGPVSELALATGTNAAGDPLVSGATDTTTSGTLVAANTTDSSVLHTVARATAAGDTTTGPSGDLVLVVNN